MCSPYAAPYNGTCPRRRALKSSSALTCCTAQRTRRVVSFTIPRSLYRCGRLQQHLVRTTRSALALCVTRPRTRGSRHGMAHGRLENRKCSWAGEVHSTTENLGKGQLEAVMRCDECIASKPRLKHTSNQNLIQLFQIRVIHTNRSVFPEFPEKNGKNNSWGLLCRDIPAFIPE